MRAHHLAARKLSDRHRFSDIPADGLPRAADMVATVAGVLAAGRSGLAPDAAIDAMPGRVAELQPDPLAEGVRPNTSAPGVQGRRAGKWQLGRGQRMVEDFSAATQPQQINGPYPAPAIDAIDHAVARSFLARWSARVGAGQARTAQNVDIGVRSGIG